MERFHAWWYPLVPVIAAVSACSDATLPVQGPLETLPARSESDTVEVIIWQPDEPCTAWYMDPDRCSV
jgi:hypothetical protein